ncbi:MAG: hypothetical protein IIA45_01455 [Bacteroidetes bacterium]|nr:hypothetical protein [Bacteroidota bacterium]
MKFLYQYTDPLTYEDLTKLLNFYFKKFPPGNVLGFYNSLKQSDWSMRILENQSKKIRRYIHIIEQELLSRTTQTNILSFSIGIFIDEEWNLNGNSVERTRVINIVKERAGLVANPLANTITTHTRLDYDEIGDGDIDAEHYEDVDEDDFFHQNYGVDDLAMGDWNYDPMNPAHDPSQNPWIDVFGPSDEAESAYRNTD